MPYVRIEITDGATYEQKLQLYKETTEMLMRILNKKPEYTFVVIEEVDNKSWVTWARPSTRSACRRPPAAPFRAWA